MWHFSSGSWLNITIDKHSTIFPRSTDSICGPFSSAHPPWSRLRFSGEQTRNEQLIKELQIHCCTSFYQCLMLFKTVLCRNVRLLELVQVCQRLYHVDLRMNLCAESFHTPDVLHQGKTLAWKQPPLSYFPL